MAFGSDRAASEPGKTGSRRHLSLCGIVPRPALALFVFASLAVAVPRSRADEREISSASMLMDRGQFAEAVKILEKAVERQGDDLSAVELRMLGECHYLVQNYGKARTFYARALPRQTVPKAKIVCEYRLALLDYRLGDLRGAEERIENFTRKYPNDSRIGSLAVVLIRIAQDSQMPRADKIRKIEAHYQRISADKERYGYYNAVLAAQALGDLYIEAGDEQKAVALFVTAVHEMRGLIAQARASGGAVPPDLGQGVDGMSLQVAKFYFARKDWGEARKWLENVSYAEDMVAQARYMLAQIAYQKGEFGEALYQLSDEVVARIPEGETKYAMYLLMAFCWRNPDALNIEKAKEALKKIPASSASYLQAQHALGDIYRDQKDGVRAEQHYLVSVKDPKYAPAALFSLGSIMKERGEAVKGLAEADKKQRDALFGKAGQYFQELLTKYPLTDMAGQAKPMVEILRNQGVSVEAEKSDEDRIAAWGKVVREKPRSNEAAQALLSLAQHHGRVALDPRTQAVIRAPNWNACAAACIPIAESVEPFAGVSPDRWREIRLTALYLLARSELGSLPPGASSRSLHAQVEPVRMTGGGSSSRAIKHLTEARTLLSGRSSPDLVRDLDYAMIEAMLKSDDKSVRDQGEKLYADSEPKYGNDPNYQRLAVITADWLDGNGFHEMAGRTYRSVAHKANMDREQVIRLLHMAGTSYGRGGRAMLEKNDKTASLGFLVKPRAAIRTGSGESAVKTGPVFQLTKRILWEQEGPGLTAGDALARVSREFGVPFVWSPAESAGSVATYMKQTVIPRATLKTWRDASTLARALGNIVDTNRFDFDYDLGISGGVPTLKAKVEEESAAEEIRAVEIFPRGRERFEALARPYGAFSSVHGGPAMLYSIIKRVEGITGGRVIWGEGVSRDEALSREFREFPGVPPGQGVTCRQALQLSLETVGLQFEVVARDYSRELIMESIDCFDELRKFGADSVYAEDAMFNIAVNLYLIRDYGRMKLLLREFLKTYDSPAFAHYYDACYWLGRLFEIDRNYREAVRCYSMASEEKVVLFRPPVGSAIPTLDQIRGRLSYDTLFNLSRKASGSFTEAGLGGEFLSFIRFYTNAEIGLDPAVRDAGLLVTQPSFVSVPCIEVLHNVMVALGLDLRTENGDKEVAEKAYYRLALVYKEDGLMREALENVQTLLSRFSNSPRLIDALKLKLDIHKGLRDYGQALEALNELRTAAGGKIEQCIIDYECGRVYFDLCDYTNAAAHFEYALSGSRDSEEWVKIREALAQTYLRTGGRERDALQLYRDNRQYETSPLRQSVYAMMIHWLEYVSSPQPREQKPLPPAEAAFIREYESLADAQRAEMSANELARATWIYYVLGMEDLAQTNRLAALKKFDAASESPDPALAAEALFQSALIYRGMGELGKARESLEHLLFSTKVVESNVRATFELAQCLKASGEPESAFRRMEELVTRYPPSPYADLVRRDPLYLQRKPPEPAPPALSTNAPSGSAAGAGGPYR